MRELKGKSFVVYAKRPFAGPAQVIEYMGRYTHRIAISNRRILALDDMTVSFQWKDYRDSDRVKVMTLHAEEFIRRFLLHVLPEEFVRLRHYGILANGRRKTKLERCRALLQAELPEITTEPQNGCEGETSEEPLLCEKYHLGRMVLREALPPSDGGSRTRSRIASFHYP